MAPPSGAIPPPLAPTVEEAYRRKCIQLKQRINEVVHDNDLSRVRVSRLERAVNKIRLERAFLLEQLSKRTSTNVEDSEGSPSPPPTPKEKPLRTKRGHRKPSFLTNLGEPSAGSAFVQQGPKTLSPSSDAFSLTHPDSHTVRNSAPQAILQKRTLPTNGMMSGMTGTPGPAPRNPKNPFELYCSDHKSRLMEINSVGLSQGTYDVDEVLGRGWRDLNDEQKSEYQIRFDNIKKGASDTAPNASLPRQAVFDGDSRPTSTAPTADDAEEDVEMADDGDEPLAAAGAGGFTSVNNG